MKDTPEKRAVKIAAQIMQNGGLCRYDTPLKCKRFAVSPSVCNRCIEQWLMKKARAELKAEAIAQVASTQK